MQPWTKIPMHPDPPHFSPYLMGLVEGEHDLTRLTDPMTRANRVAAIIMMFQAVMELGNQEHSGDWDWNATVVVDGPSTYEYIEALSLGQRYTKPGEIEWLIIAEFNKDHIPPKLMIPLQHIISITIKEAR